MKKLALFFTAVFLIGASVSAKTTTTYNNYRDYGNSFIFTEGGIEFSVFPDGQFDFYAPNYGPNGSISINTPNVSFSFNTGYDYSPYVQYDDFGAIIQIENVPIYYDYYGRITQAGNVNIHYNNFGYVSNVGGLYVYYNSNRVFSHCTGFINVYNRVYVYQPWHRYYTVPAPNYCIVYSRPYRQYYKPVRYHYYRPYTNNYRQPVHYNYRSVTNNGRRNAVANNSRISDRYRQEATPRHAEIRTRRNDNRTLAATNTRSLQNNRTTSDAVRTQTPRRATVQNDRTVRTREKQNVTKPQRSVSNNQRTIKKNAIVRKPRTSNNRISNKEQSQY
ncbi:MAG: hypothetical protein KDC68_08235, partial [Gelidibacter sp.]|nr:hypothetical protein [Gelidibacter sp.]